MNYNKFNPPYLMWREDFISNTFFSSVSQYFGVRSLQGKNNQDLLFVFKVYEPLNSKDTQRISSNFNLFTLVTSAPGTVTYQCRIDARDGIYNFQIQIEVDDTVQSDVAVLYNITSSSAQAEEYVSVPQTDFTNPIFVSDNCYNPDTNASLATSTPIARNGSVEVTFSKEIFLNNRFGVSIYKGLSNESNYSFVSNGSTMDSGLTPNIIIDDENGQKALFSGATATDVTPNPPVAGDVIQSDNYQLSIIPSINNDVLTLTPSTGTFAPGNYIYHIAADGLTDMAGNFFAGKTNMFIVA